MFKQTTESIQISYSLVFTLEKVYFSCLCILFDVEYIMLEKSSKL